MTAPRPPTPAPPARPDQAGGLRTVRRDLLGAQPEKVARVVAMVDALPDRGDADALIAPLRPRLAQMLAQMHLSRPLTLSRLAFVPLEPVLVAGPAWRRGAPGVPRTALRCFWRAIRAGLGEAAEAFEASLAGHTVDAHAVARAVGPQLWPRAAALLLVSPVPADWQERTGLGVADHAALAHTAAAVLEQAPALREVVEPSRVPADGANAPTWPSLMEAALARPPMSDGPNLPTLVAVMLAEAPRPEAVLEAMRPHENGPGGPAVRGACETGVGFALQRLGAADSVAGDLARATAEVHRQATLLDDLQAWAEARPSQRASIATARRTLDVACRDRFAAVLRDGLAAPVPHADGSGGGDAGEIATAEVVGTLEQAARDLRGFQHAARRVGGAGYYEDALRDAARGFADARAGAAGLTHMDRVRLVELLQGPEAALLVLQAG